MLLGNFELKIELNVSFVLRAKHLLQGVPCVKIVLSEKLVERTASVRTVPVENTRAAKVLAHAKIA